MDFEIFVCMLMFNNGCSSQFCAILVAPGFSDSFAGNGALNPVPGQYLSGLALKKWQIVIFSNVLYTRMDKNQAAYDTKGKLADRGID